MYAVFASLASASEVTTREDLARGLPFPGVPAAPYPTGWSLHFRLPRRHPEREEWAVDIADFLTAYDGATVDRLPADWTPPPPPALL